MLSKKKKTILRRLEFLSLLIIGSLAGVLLFGTGTLNLGVLNADISLKPSMVGSTKIDLGLLGSIKFQSHKGPLEVDMKVNSLSTESAGKLLKSESQIRGIRENISESLKDTILSIAWHSMLGGACLTFLLVLISFRRFKIALLALITSMLLNAGVGFYAYLTYKPEAIKQPVYQGLVASAPKLIGSAKDIAENFNLYRDQMASLLQNVGKLYSASSSLPDYNVEGENIVLLHVSDIHLNPEAWNLMAQVVKEFGVQAIMDTGDISDHGTAFEDSFLTQIPKFKIPYIYVRGNHDSAHTQSVISSFKNAKVLDKGEIYNFRGLKIAGYGDPQFTPDKSLVFDLSKTENGIKDFALALRKNPADLALVHDPAFSTGLDGLVDLILAGHLHKRNTGYLPKGSILMIEGSTGGSGLRMLTDKKIPDPLTATILYIDKNSHRLKAYDEITMGGLGSASIQIARKTGDQVKPMKKPPTLND